MRPNPTEMMSGGRSRPKVDTLSDHMVRKKLASCVDAARTYEESIYDSLQRV